MTAVTGRRAWKTEKETDQMLHDDGMYTFTLGELFSASREEINADPARLQARLDRGADPRSPTPRHADDRTDPDRE